MNACEFAVELTTFCKAPFSAAFIELNGMWANIDSLKRMLSVLAEKRPHLFECFVRSEQQAVMAVQSLKLPRHVFCYGRRAPVTAFNWPLPIDGAVIEGMLRYPSQEQLRCINQRVMAMRAFTVHMDQVYVHNVCSPTTRTHFC